MATAGCSRDGSSCAGSTYHPDLAQAGAKSPIQALEAWLGTDTSLPDPPDEGWVVQDSGAKDPARVMIENDDGDGWWVAAARTEAGGWVVEQATASASGCDDLPGA
jgi:hypothetical protein